MDRLGDFLSIQSPLPLTDPQLEAAKEWKGALKIKGVYYKKLNRMVQQSTKSSASPRLIMGLEAPDEFEVMENGLKYRLRLNQGYSTGLFLDMRENRHRIMTNQIKPKRRPMRGQAKNKNSCSTWNNRYRAVKEAKKRD